MLSRIPGINNILSEKSTFDIINNIFYRMYIDLYLNENALEKDFIREYTIKN